MFLSGLALFVRLVVKPPSETNAVIANLLIGLTLIVGSLVILFVDRRLPPKKLSTRITSTSVRKK